MTQTLITGGMVLGVTPSLAAFGWALVRLEPESETVEGLGVLRSRVLAPQAYVGLEQPGGPGPRTPTEPLCGDLETSEGVCYEAEADGSLRVAGWRHGGAAARPARQRIEGAEARQLVERYLGRDRAAQLFRERAGR